MKKIISIISCLAVMATMFILPVQTTALTSPNWDISGNWVLDFAGGGANREFRNMVQDEDGSVSGEFWGTSYGGKLDGYVNGDTLYLSYDRSPIDYTGEFLGTITSSGISGTFHSLTTGFDADWHTVSGTPVFNRYAEIIKPEESEIVFGNLNLEAYLFNNDEDYIDWAVREGTCMAGTNTVLGNVDGRSDLLTMTQDGYTYTYTGLFDVTGFEGGMYCFIFNPREDAGETNIRLTREFYIAEGGVSGGGQIIEEKGPKPKDNLKISFGGYAWDLGLEGYVGEWQINFHNVGKDDYDKAIFHANEINVMNFYLGDSETCDKAMNMTLTGTLNGESGYKVIFRAGDLGEGRCGYKDFVDTVRIELKQGNDTIYDTHWEDEFSDESNCLGTARTGLDNGNITIEF